MADPTLRDVLAALVKLTAKVDTIDGKLDTKAAAAEMRSRFETIDGKLDTKADAAEIREGFAAVRKDIAALDRDIDGHMKVHREIEKDLETLKKRPARTAARATRAPRPAWAVAAGSQRPALDYVRDRADACAQPRALGAAHSIS